MSCHYVAHARYMAVSAGFAALHPRLFECDRYAVENIPGADAPGYTTSSLRDCAAKRVRSLRCAPPAAIRR
jgi:hypothetical protein